MDPEVWECVNWWDMWKKYGALPYGGADLMLQPHYIVEAIMAAEDTYQVLQAEAQQDNGGPASTT